MKLDIADRKVGEGGRFQESGVSIWGIMYSQKPKGYSKTCCPSKEGQMSGFSSNSMGVYVTPSMFEANNSSCYHAPWLFPHRSNVWMWKFEGYTGSTARGLTSMTGLR